MRILVVTNMYPSKDRPASGIFVQQQVKGLTDAGMEVELMVVDRGGKGPSAYYGIDRRVSEQMASSKCDLAHVMYGGVMAGAIINVVRQVPTVVSICGSDLLGTAGQWPIAPLRSWVSRRASIKACNMADGIVVKSEGLAKALPTTIDRSKVHIVPNGVDMDRFRPMDRDLCVRQLGWGVDAFHIVFSLGEDPLTKRLELAQQVTSLTRQLGVAAEFHILKNVPHDKVSLYLNAGDVLLLTSVHEGSPNIVKEALACNMPIVSVDVGDVAERIRDIEGCFIVPPNPASIAQKLKAVAVRRSRIEGRPHILHLSVLKVAERLEAIYRSLLKKRQPSHN